MSTLVRSFLPPARRPTYYFLQYAKRFNPVFLSVDVDMSAVQQAREERTRRGQERLSYITYVIHVAARVLRKHPEANCSVKHAWLPRFARHESIHAKFTMDKVVDGERVVGAGLVQHADQAPLEAIQARIDELRAGDFHTSKEFANARALRRLPLGVGQWLYAAALSNLGRRERLQGNFTVTSVGHRPIQSFFPITSTTLCFGLGAIMPRPVVRDGAVVTSDIMTLSLTFDHSAIDGAPAADILTEVKSGLETAFGGGE
jgi:pyruvate/2-oxoglutarate dehydrogenase complex dihydrolipoamide acyltransferase (E2) component